MGLTQSEAARFIKTHCRLETPVHVPEIRLWTAGPTDPIWAGDGRAFETLSLLEPFWAFAWSGGQAIARYLLDHPAKVRGRRVLDLASGGGVSAIAAAKAGARSVCAVDIDPMAPVAIRLNAAANGVAIDARLGDALTLLSAERLNDATLVLAGDVFFDATLASAFIQAFDDAKGAGAEILVGDPGRSYFPKDAFEHLALYETAPKTGLQDAELRRASVWRFRQGRFR